MSLTTCQHCDRIAVPGFDFCDSHGGGSNYKFNNERIARAVSKKKNSDTLFSLRDDVAILRVTLEETLNGQGEDEGLQAVSGLVVSQIEAITRTLTACQKLEIISSTVMSMDEVTALLNDIAEIVAVHVDDVEVIKNIALGVGDRLEKLKQDQRENINDHEL